MPEGRLMRSIPITVLFLLVAAATQAAGARAPHPGPSRARGGGWERGSALPVIWIFTCNGRGEKGTTPPGTFEPRFLSRCLVVACERPEVTEISQFVRHIWALEGGDTSSDPSLRDRSIHPKA